MNTACRLPHPMDGSGAPAYLWPPSSRAEGMPGWLGRWRDRARRRALEARAREDSRIIRRCQDGDLKAFETLVRRYMETALRLSRGWLRDTEDAVDASQDAFVKALEALPRFDPEQPFFPWFYAILRNTALSRLRRLKARGEVPLDESAEPAEAAPGPRAAGVETPSRESLRDQVRAALGHLKPEHREAVMLRHWEEMSYEEIAAATGVPVGTVMSRLHYARRRLRRLLGPSGEGE